MFDVSIPPILNEELQKRYSKIKPVVTRNGKLHLLREFTPEELGKQSYLWNIDEDIREEINGDCLEPLVGKDFVCLHKYEYHEFFIPTIKDVLAQIDEKLLPHVCAFEIIDSPKEKSADFRKDSFTSIIFSRGFHVSIVRLYRKKIDA